MVGRQIEIGIVEHHRHRLNLVILVPPDDLATMLQDELIADANRWRDGLA